MSQKCLKMSQSGHFRDPIPTFMNSIKDMNKALASPGEKAVTNIHLYYILDGLSSQKRAPAATYPVLQDLTGLS